MADIARADLCVCEKCGHRTRWPEWAGKLVDAADQREGAVEALAILYRANAQEVARVCDEEADRSGRLLGIVRAHARQRGGRDGG